MKKTMNFLVILITASLLGACGPHRHIVKANSVTVVPQKKQVVLVKPVKVRHFRKWHY